MNDEQRDAHRTMVLAFQSWQALEREEMFLWKHPAHLITSPFRGDYPQVRSAWCRTDIARHDARGAFHAAASRYCALMGTRAAPAEEAMP